MDFQSLVSEIVARVALRMEESGEKSALLVLTPQHGEHCHAVLESPRLSEYYRLDCALQNEYNVCMDNYEGVILFGLTNENLTRLTGGVCDTPFTSLAQKAILLGKKIFLPEEEIELFHYQQTAPPAYYRMLADKLTLLQASGVAICAPGTLEDAVLSGAPAPRKASGAAVCAVCKAGEARIDKRVVTEKDMAQVCGRDTGTVRVGKKTILTDLAREYAHAKHITVIRE